MLTPLMRYLSQLCREHTSHEAVLRLWIFAWRTLRWCRGTTSGWQLAGSGKHQMFKVTCERRLMAWWVMTKHFSSTGTVNSMWPYDSIDNARRPTLDTLPLPPDSGGMQKLKAVLHLGVKAELQVARAHFVTFIHIVQGRSGGLLQFSKGKLLRCSWHVFHLALTHCSCQHYSHFCEFCTLSSYFFCAVNA